MLLLHPASINCTGCSRRVTAAVARCIIFPDVLSFTDDSSAARVRGRDSGPKRASTSRKVHSCWSSSTCWEATSSWSPLCLNPANIWGAGPSRGLLSLSQYFRACAGLLLVTYCSLSCPWSLSSWSVWSSLLNGNMARWRNTHNNSNIVI